jgi:hypothetical protein
MPFKSCILFCQMKKEKDWFRIKRYPHIGQPIKMIDKSWVNKYVTNTVTIKNHAFYPFIHRSSLKRKYRRDIDRKTGMRSKMRLASVKPRELYYANHLDSNIFSYYASLLNEAYNKRLRIEGLDRVVTAYRKIQIDPSNINSPSMSSSDFAAEVFNYILTHKAQKLIAVTLDIKGFFDNLDHKKLKQAWYSLNSSSKTLKEDEYNVFKNITNFSYINENQLFNAVKDKIIVQKKSGVQKHKPIKRLHHLKKQGAIAFCNKEDFETEIRSKNLIIGNGSVAHIKRTKGIPQGSPISSVLANIYMLPFDIAINKQVSEWEGLYRRYSDDMIVICDESYLGDLVKLFDDKINERSLDIQHDKTQIFKFSHNGIRYECGQQYELNFHSHKNLEYLGFEFDGYHSLIKSASLSNYYRRMKRSCNKSKFYAKTTGVSRVKGEIFKSRLYKRYSYLGSGRKRLWRPDKSDPKKWNKTEFYNWGNYISYAKLAASRLPNQKIDGQLKRHWNILNVIIKKAV